MREATLGANMRVAAIVEERVRRAEVIGRKQSLEENEGRMQVKCARIAEFQKRQRERERVEARGGKNFLSRWTAS
jgi:hypothetical protein